MINNHILKILNKTIFVKKYSYISLIKIVKNLEHSKYLIVEFIDSKNNNFHHIPNAFQILKTNYVNVNNLISKKNFIVINNGIIGSRFYYNFLKKNGYKCYILKNYWK